MMVPVWQIVVLAFGACGSAAALRACDALLPRLATEYGVGLGAAAQTVTAFAIAYGVMQLAYGPIGDRYGKYRVITVATFASAITSFACAWAPTLGALVFTRLLGGATAGALIPLSIAWIGDVVPYRQRQPVLARFLMGQMSGVALGQFLGGLGADRFGAQPVFLFLAGWFLFAAVLMWRFPPEDAAAASTITSGNVVGNFVAVLQIPWARVVIGTVFVEAVLLFGALAFIPTHLHHWYGVSLTAAGSIVMLYSVGGILFATLSRALLRRLGEAGLAAGGAVLLALCLPTIALGSRVPVAMLGCLMAGMGFYMLQNTLQVNATQMAPTQRGSGFALFAAVMFVGQSTGVAVAGLAAERFGTAPVISGAGVLLLVLGLAFARARRRYAPPLE